MMRLTELLRCGTIAVTASLALSLPVRADAPEPPIYLNQNWTAAERTEFYFTPQGSQLLPLAWFLALEQGRSAQPFIHPSHIARLGFLNDENAYGANNPEGLPVGFAKEPVAGGETWVGMTCAACHTGEIRFEDQTVRIDGAPTLGDFTGFCGDLIDALRATLDQPLKFGRFARRVLDHATSLERGDLRLRVRTQLEWLERFHARSTPTHAYGYGRVDAFGIIMNEVFGREMQVPENVANPGAPVSYPFLWSTPQHDWVQWNGSANNPFGRNLGEVLGVFGRVELKDPQSPNLGQSTARARELFRLEQLVAKLTPPQWPEALLGPIDQAKAARGRELYLTQRGDEPSCARCHALPDGDGHYPMTPPEENDFGARFIETTMTGLTDIGTDPLMALNFAGRRVQTGNLAGLLGAAEMRAPELLSTLVGMAMGKAIATTKPAFSPEQKAELIGYRIKAPGFPPYRPRNLLAYRARPLDGVWATAPFLHNGSVANLYQLLLPPAERLPRFYLGNHRFDAEDVGYRSKHSDHAFEFDTSLPGNQNSGHNYGTDLSEGERRDLIEFLKTL